MTTIFIKHPIKDEKSLPKEKGTYIFRWVNEADNFTFDPKCKEDVDFWLEHGKFWLEEREVPTDEEIIEQIEKSFSNTEYGTAKGVGFHLGIKWFKSKLGIK